MAIVFPRIRRPAPYQRALRESSISKFGIIYKISAMRLTFINLWREQVGRETAWGPNFGLFEVANIMTLWET